MLVVCQKKAALDVVAARLKREGLGELYFQVDDAESDRRRIVEVLRDQERPVVSGNVEEEHTALAREIEQLEKEFQTYGEALFRVRDQHGVNYRTMLARRCRIERECPDVHPLDALRELLQGANDGELRQLTAVLAELEGLFREADVGNNPWKDSRDGLTGDRYQLERIQADLRRALEPAEGVDRWVGGPPPVRGKLVGSLQNISESAGYLRSNWAKLGLDFLSKIPSSEEIATEIKDMDFARVAAAVHEVVSWRQSLLRVLSVFSPSFRRSRRLIREFVAVRCWSRQQNGYQVFGEIAARAKEASDCEKVLESVSRWLQDKTTILLMESLRTAEPVAHHLRQLIDYLAKLPLLLRYIATVRALDERSQKAVQELEHGPRGASKNWGKIAELSALLAWAGEAESEQPILRSMTPERYDVNRKRLSELVQHKRKLESQAIRFRWANRWQEIDHQWRQGLRFRGRRSQRLREIVETGKSRGLFKLRPCWLVNPGTASQIFPLDAGLFDLVILDEASQCPPEYALPTLYRARRAIVAGDGKQLPPTMFFKTAFDFDGEEAEEEEMSGPEDRMALEIAAGAEDLLALAQVRLPEAHLKVHYRSRDPVLIAFSNAAFYRNRLEAPQPAREVVTLDNTPALFMERVDGIYQSNRTNPEEARRVVEYLRRLWKEENPPTVGVVAFNEAQCEEIEDLLDLEANRDTEFHLAYEREVTRTEDGQDVGFFVKSLEAVQGDERDVILFSTTYGRREDGRFIRSFLGPINRQGGERRLNVAITRAKLWVRIFTSLPINELASALTPGAVETADAAGRAMLQLYLTYAEHISNGQPEAAMAILRRARELGGILGEHPGHVGDEESEFEIEVRDALRNDLDLQIDTQVASGSFRIDLAVRAPNGGGYILGIECDGKAYHSAPSARAYDHWRQKVLEDRGWKIHRIWSTVWTNDRSREIRKVEELIEKILPQLSKSRSQ